MCLTDGPPTSSHLASVLPIGTVYEGDLPQATPTAHQPSAAEEVSTETTMPSEPKRTREERKLAVMMMSKKRKRLFEHIMKARKKKGREVSELKRKRREYDETKLGHSKRIRTSS